MYTVAIQMKFIAQHYLIGGDWGAENELHSHHYIVELRLAGEELDQHGYLVDIVDIEATLLRVIDKYQDQTLNQLPEFEGLNPSIEHFSRILCLELDQRIQAENIRALTVVLWENDIAWASFRHER